AGCGALSVRAGLTRRATSRPALCVSGRTCGNTSVVNAMSNTASRPARCAFRTTEKAISSAAFLAVWTGNANAMVCLALFAVTATIGTSTEKIDTSRFANSAQTLDETYAFNNADTSQNRSWITETNTN